MTKNVDYTASVLNNLAGVGVNLNPALSSVFTQMLSRQVQVQPDGSVETTYAFGLLAKIFTFVATPVSARPASFNSYSNADLAAAMQAAEEGLAGANGVFLLTEGIDILQGTSADDVFKALPTAAGAQTLQNDDVVGGGLGVDTLEVSLPSFTRGDSTRPALDSIEKIYVQALNSAQTLDLAQAFGVQEVWADASQNSVVFDNVKDQVLVGVRKNAPWQQFVVDYEAGAVAATGTQTISLYDATLLLQINQQGTALAVQNVAVESNGTNNELEFLGNGNNILTSAVLQNLTITGNAALEIGGDVAITAGTIDASSMSAGSPIELTVGNVGAGNLASGVAGRSITLGAGDDSLTVLEDISAGFFDGGSGSDAIVVEATSGTLINDLTTNVTGFEQLGLNNLNQAINAQTLADIGFTELLALLDAAGGTINGLNSAVNVWLLDKEMGQDSITLNVAGAIADSEASFGFKVVGNEGYNSSFAVTINDVENLTVVSENDEDSESFYTTTLELVSNALKNLTIKGDEAIWFDGSDIATLQFLDASGVSDSQAGETQETTSLEVGDGVGVIGSAQNDKISFGESNTITGGAGADIFVVSSISIDGASTPQFSTITDLNANQNDSIHFDGTQAVLSTAGGGTAVNVITASDLAVGAPDTLESYLAVASSQLAGVVSGFELAGNTYIVADNNSGASTFSAETDFMVELAGFVNLLEFSYV